jgi:hypothetical protein
VSTDLSLRVKALQEERVRRSLKLSKPKSRSESGLSDPEGHVSTDHELQEKAKVEC